MNLFNATPRTQRMLIFLTLAMASTYFAALVFLMEIFPPPSPDISADQVALIYSHANLKFRIGVAIMIITGGFYIPWSMVIAVQMDRIEKRTSIWTMLQAVVSASGTWIFALPPLLWGAAAFNAGRDPAITGLMHELGFLVFYCASSFFPFQLIAISIVSLSERNTDPHTAFPRWLGWLCLWAGVIASEGFVGVIFNSGPFSWNGIFVFWLPVIIFTIWMIAMTIMMFRAIALQEKHGTQ